MTLKKCVICDGINFSKKVSVRDPLKKSTKYSLMLCLSCKTVSTTPIPKDLDQYYSVNYDSYQKKTSLFSKIYSFAQNLNNYRKTKILKQINAKSILDYGCGSGSFVRYTSKRCYETNGYEPINDTNDTNISDSMETFKNKNFDSNIAHEATTSKISEEQLHYCQQRGLNPEEAVGLIVNGFCKEVLQQLPMEFAVEAQKLVGISLEGSVG